MCEDYRDPELLPRIGEEYQVEIPPLVAEYDRSTDSKLLGGLAIPIMWIKGEVEDIKLEPVGDLVESTNVSECIRVTQKISDCHDLKLKVEPMDVALDREHIKRHQKYTDNSCRLVPGFAGDNIDEASFLLGLYIFGKNFVRVKKFIESNSMGEILSFYYGKFYRSEKYRRWSECRKMRGRKCIFGERIFTGLRQQELLSRLLHHVSEECHSTSLEVSKAFGEGKISLEVYVLTLRDKVGLNALVKAVGIGKGKEDLTSMAVAEPLKLIQGGGVQPVGKAWSMLTPSEIITFLTGDYRLSKARSNDLFWEAVWPRLLARGWHSEQPKNYSCVVGSKHSLVFLIPGVEKFSRKKLVKGDHYFDSVRDVLSKVAAKPGLLELEIGIDNRDSSKDGNGWTEETKLDVQDCPDQQRQCYLKPRTPSRGMDSMKFTVVDTSWANGGTVKVRDLRSLPVEMRNNSILNSYSENSDGETSEDSTVASGSSDTIYSHRNEQNDLKTRKIITDSDRSPNKSFPIIVSGLSSSPSVKISAKKINKRNGMSSRKRINAQLNQRLKPEDEVFLGPVKKRCRRLNACNRTQLPNVFNSLVGSKLKKDEAGCLGNLSLGENISFKVNPSKDQLSLTNSTLKGCPVGCDDIILGSGVENHYEEPPLLRMIDLNLPVSPEAENDEHFIEEMERQLEQASMLPHESNKFKDVTDVATSEQQPEVQARRHSTRNRPPTTKALEALAFGFLSTKQKRKFGDSFPQESSCHSRARKRVDESLGGSIPNTPAEDKGDDLLLGFLSTKRNQKLGDSFLCEPSCHSHARNRVTENLGGSIPDTTAQRKGDDLCYDNGRMVSEFQL